MLSVRFYGFRSLQPNQPTGTSYPRTICKAPPLIRRSSSGSMAMAAMIASAPSPNPMRSLQLNNNSNNNACKYLSFSLQLPLLCFANHNNSNKAATSTAGGAWRQSMFLNAKPLIKDGALRFNGKNAVLMGVPDNVLLTPCTDSSAFVGATNSPHSSSRLVFKLGTLTQDTRFLCLFRFKIFWMIPRVGNKGSDIPVETQMLLLEAREPRGSVSYVLFLPVLDGQFRSSLQGNSANELEICVESGDPAVVASESLKAVFVNNGNNPFDLMTESMNCCGVVAAKNSPLWVPCSWRWGF